MTLENQYEFWNQMRKAAEELGYTEDEYFAWLKSRVVKNQMDGLSYRDAKKTVVEETKQMIKSMENHV